MAFWKYLQHIHKLNGHHIPDVKQQVTQVPRGNAQDNWVFTQLTCDEGARAPRSLTAPAPGDPEQRLVGLPCAWLFAKPSRKMSCLSPQSCGVATAVCISQTKRRFRAGTQTDSTPVSGVTTAGARCPGEDGLGRGQAPRLAFYRETSRVGEGFCSSQGPSRFHCSLKTR